MVNPNGAVRAAQTLQGSGCFMRGLLLWALAASRPGRMKHAIQSLAIMTAKSDGFFAIRPPALLADMQIHQRNIQWVDFIF